MDVKILHNLMDGLKKGGCSINEDLVPVLYNSLIQLQSENHFDSVYLWGRIVTLTKDYYIAYGYQEDPIKNRTFFYTQNIVEWDIMPTDWSIVDSDLVYKIKTKFNGNPRHMEAVKQFNKKSHETTKFTSTPSIIINEEMEEGSDEHKEKLEGDIFNDVMSVFEADETMEMESIIMATKNMIKEEDRLALTVKMIDNEGHIVPRGYFYKLPNGNVVKAPYFKGLNYSEIGDNKNFFHINLQYFQSISTSDKVQSDYNGSIDFLDSIENDIPKGCWTRQNVSNQYLTVHNLLWPGALFVQDMNTGAHGFFYSGDGIKNLDVPFMI